MKPHEHLSTLLQVAESGVTAGDLAGPTLWTVEPAMKARDAIQLMRHHDFEVAAVADEAITSYVTTHALEGRASTVAQCSIPIAASDLVSASLPLSDLVVALAGRSHYFLLDRSRVSGIVTRADLQLPPVSMVTLGLILAIESGLETLIRRETSDAWERLIPLTRQRAAERILAQRRAHGVDISLLECLLLCDRLAIARKVTAIRAALNFTSVRSFDQAAKRVERLRNVLAHGGSLLDACSDPIDAIERFRLVRDLAQRTADAAGDVSHLIDAYANTTISSGRRMLTGPSASALPYPTVFVISACNPRSVLRTPAENESSHRLLRRQLRDAVSWHRQAKGESPDGDWSEVSVAVAGIEREEACQYGARFGQLAIFELDHEHLRVVRCVDQVVVATRSRMD
jgi:hypothetical protein